MGLCGSAPKAQPDELQKVSFHAATSTGASLTPKGAPSNPATTSANSHAQPTEPVKPAAVVTVSAPTKGSTPRAEPTNQQQAIAKDEKLHHNQVLIAAKIDTTAFVRDMTEAFNVMAEKQGYIVAMELRELLPTLQPDITREEMDVLVKEADPTSRGKIFLEPFLRMMINYRQIQNAPDDAKQEALESFQILDPENKGYVKAEELKQLMPEINDKLTEEEIDAMIRSADPDGTGTIYRPSFVRMMTDPKIPRT